MAIDYQFSAGHRLDDFKIETPLYKGALAEVYRAIDLMTRQFVVIKVPSSDVINHPLVFYHYQNEMRILSRVRHPNIVGTIQRHRTSAYSIFEYVPGISLRQHLLRRKWMSLQEALHFAQQIARGLGYLHDCGIIHLDIKPDNILITPEGKVKIIDFGLARHLGTPDLLFEDFARPHGTPDYVSPEQLAHHRDDPRADQYSLSLVLYEMLTGRLPFEKSQRLSFVRRRVKIPPIGPRRFRKEIPLAVEAVILKALSVDPGARYGSVAEFGVALQAAGQSADAGRRPSTTDAASSTGSDGSPFTLHCALPASAAVLPCVLAAIDDDGQAEAVADTALQAAMTDGLPVTLLTVVAADAADDWIRYGDEARGKRLSRQLEQLSLKFRHFGIDPSVRIKSGRPADVIIETAKTVGAGLIVAGASRTRLIKRIFGGNTLDRVLKRTNCPVVTAGPVRQPWFPEERIPEELTLEEIRQADTFLTALWIGQIDWLATLVHGLLTESPAPRKAIAEGGPVADWLKRIHARAAWAPVIKDLQCAFDQLMDAARDMAASPHLHERRLLCRIYLRDALPSICRLREALQGISMALRHRARLADEVRPTGLLRRPVCPIEEKRPVSSGPIQQLQALKAHFCSQAVANGDQRGLVADHDHDHGHRV